MRQSVTVLGPGSKGCLYLLGATSISSAALQISGRLSMDPLGSLREEHTLVLRELYTLDHQLGWLESSPPAATHRALVQLLSTSQKLASDLTFHFQKEEKSLYSLLERRMANNAEPVILMREEHKRLSLRLDSFT